jgi:hypothetical protein
MRFKAPCSEDLFVGEQIVRLGIFMASAVIGLMPVAGAKAQQVSSPPVEPPVSLGQPAVMLDANGQRAVEGTLRTTSLHGAPDTPVTNTTIVLRNVSPHLYEFVSGHASFYDSSGVRCGEGLFKASALTPNETAETDTPGIRITCNAVTWRITASNLVPQNPQAIGGALVSLPVNLVISVDGEEHPIQLGKPFVVNLGDKKRTIVVRSAP